MDELMQAVSTLLASGPRTHQDVLTAFPDERPGRVTKALIRLAKDGQVEWAENKTIRLVGSVAAPAPVSRVRTTPTPAPRE